MPYLILVRQFQFNKLIVLRIFDGHRSAVHLHAINLLNLLNLIVLAQGHFVPF